jgi:hypothetical protein
MTIIPVFRKQGDDDLDAGPGKVRDTLCEKHEIQNKRLVVKINLMNAYLECVSL